MVTQNDVVAAVKAAIQDKFPDSTVYTNLVPNRFERPSFLVENTDIALTASTGSSVTLQITIRVICFVAVDEYHYSQLETLNVRQLAVLGIFAPLYLKVGDRALDVQKLTGGAGGRDWIDITVVLNWDEDLESFMTLPDLPVMEDLNMNLEGKAYGNAEY